MGTGKDTECCTYDVCCTEMKKFLCTWLGEVCYSCSLTVLPGPAWVVLNHVLQRIFFTSVLMAKLCGYPMYDAPEGTTYIYINVELPCPNQRPTELQLTDVW